MSGTQDIVIAGGVEVMSMVPIGASIVDGMNADHGFPFNAEGIEQRYPGVFFLNWPVRRSLKLMARVRS